MSCQQCRGKPWLCERCRMEELERLYGVPDDRFETADEIDDNRETLPHKCTQCGNRYETDGSDPCPSCGSRRRRYDGELEARA